MSFRGRRRQIFTSREKHILDEVVGMAGAWC